MGRNKGSKNKITLDRIKLKQQELLMITDILGRPAKPGNRQVLLFIYSDGTVEKKYIR